MGSTGAKMQSDIIRVCGPKSSIMGLMYFQSDWPNPYYECSFHKVMILSHHAKRQEKHSLVWPPNLAQISKVTDQKKRIVSSQTDSIIEDSITWGRNLQKLAKRSPPSEVEWTIPSQWKAKSRNYWWLQKEKSFPVGHYHGPWRPFKHSNAKDFCTSRWGRSL